MAASGGLTFIVVSVVVFVIVAAFLVIHLKKGRNFNRRVRSDSNIERLLREAFIGDDNVIRMSPVTETGDTTPTTSPNNQR
jgi:predicted signal transduction protein with EAL and GGDEF domain